MTLQERKIGIIGSGQLGKMLLEEAVKWDLNTSILANEEDAPCKILCKEYIVCESYFDFNSIYNFGKSCHTLTIEIEHVNVDALEKLEQEGILVYPQPRVLRTIQNKALQKAFYLEHKIPTAHHTSFKNKTDLLDDITGGRTNLPFVQKLCTGGYDGKGVAIINTMQDLDLLLEGESIVEDKIEIDTEFAVIAARNALGETVVYDAVEMAFDDEANLLDLLVYPARIDEVLSNKVKDLAVKVSDAFSHIGLLAVEMFTDKNGNLFVNEVAPRPHNSGHHTIEASECSQFEQHLRAILNLPLGSTSVLQPAVMLNLVGAKNFTGRVWYEGFEKIISTAGVYVHLYGKSHTKPFRKMGHITICQETIEEAISLASQLKKEITVKSKP